MPTKIESHLTPEQFFEFCARCAQIRGGRKGAKLADIQALADEFGITISLMSAKSFRDGPFAEYLDELRAKREMAETVASVAKSGLSLSDAAASVLSQKIFDQALELDANGEEALDQSNTLSLALSRLRIGDQRARFLEAKLQEMQREQTEWDEKRRKVVEQLDRAKSATPASADEVRAAAVAEIDRIMGITPKAKK